MSIAVKRVHGMAPALQLASRVVLGAVLLWAGGLKVGDQQGMLLTIDAYDVLPEAAARIVAAGLPWLEMTLGAFLILGLFVRFSALATAILFLAFLFGMVQALARGLAIDCGCFGVGGSGGGITWVDILRDLALLGMAVFLVLVPRGPWSLDARLKIRETDEDG